MASATCTGSADATRRKSHREPTLRDAATALGRQGLDDVLARDDHDHVLNDVATLLASTDLVPVRQAQTLMTLPVELRRGVAEALHAMLHGEDRYGPRFQAWVLALREALGAQPSWWLATAPSALLHPNEHVCVRPSTFKRQAALFAPTRIYSTRPRHRSYANFREVAETTREWLVDAGLRPRDLLDVHDFIWVTLRPAAAQHRSGA